jgi:cell division protein FtsN
MFSWIRSTPGKSSIILGNAERNTIAIENRQEKSNFEKVREKLPEGFNPAAVCYGEIRGLTEKEVKSPVTSPKLTQSNRFFIIGGAFRDYNNAAKMKEELIRFGYPSEIIDTTARGMYVVSIQGFDSRKSAREALPVIREAGYPNAWVMHKP